MAEAESLPAGETAASAPAYSRAQLVTYFFKLGTIGSGGPAALTGYVHRDLVERRGWITQAEYKDGRALAQLASGPLAAFVDGVTAAAIGAITGAVFVLGRGSVIDVPTAGVAIATVVLLMRFGRRAPEPLIVLVAAVLGLALGAG